MIKSQEQVKLKIDKDNPNHHIWLNRGVWWCHFTVHQNAESKRIRFSLKTTDVEVARKRRDKIIYSFQENDFIAA